MLWTEKHFSLHSAPRGGHLSQRNLAETAQATIKRPPGKVLVGHCRHLHLVGFVHLLQTQTQKTWPQTFIILSSSSNILSHFDCVGHSLFLSQSKITLMLVFLVSYILVCWTGNYSKWNVDKFWCLFIRAVIVCSKAMLNFYFTVLLFISSLICCNFILLKKECIEFYWKEG